MTEIHFTSRAVIIHRDHILLAYDPRTPPMHYYDYGQFFYYLPGGHIEHAENAADCLVRELQEELGYNGKIKKFLGIIEYFWETKDQEICCHTHEINIIFEVEVNLLFDLKILPQQETHVAFQWIPFKDLLSIDLRPIKLRNVLLRWLEGNFDAAFNSSNN